MGVDTGIRREERLPVVVYEGRFDATAAVMAEGSTFSFDFEVLLIHPRVLLCYASFAFPFFRSLQRNR